MSHRLKIAAEIKEIREKRGWSQAELAAMLQISRSTISKIENGKFAISVDYLIRFSMVLNHSFVVIQNSFDSNQT